MFRFQVGPFAYQIESKIPCVVESVERMYTDYPRLTAEDWIDFHVRVVPEGGLIKRLLKPQARLFLDNSEPFGVFNQNQAGAILEWGMNWCLWLNVNHWIIFHAAMLERNGRGLILAADSGDGKSTLAAALAFSGWRLLSDELTLIDPDDQVEIQPGAPPIARMVPIPRPICLKNSSIDAMQAFLPDLTYSLTYPETTKGRVTHVKPLKDAVDRMFERPAPRWIVFPKYVPGSEPKWTPWEKAEAFIKFGGHGRGYSMLGQRGFETVANIIHHCDCWRFEYSRLEDAVREFETLQID
ncbi:MAG: HprK-related kinase A [Thermoguttaceae bacterium]|nr:HprK-related kinase A [Thermoguttaceae bacterium]